MPLASISKNQHSKNDSKPTYVEEACCASLLRSDKSMGVAKSKSCWIFDISIFALIKCKFSKVDAFLRLLHVKKCLQTTKPKKD